MARIIYENEDAVFTFDYQDILRRLTQTIQKDHFHDIIMLCKWLQDKSKEGQEDIQIDSEHIYWQEKYIYQIVYVIRDLFSDHKGLIYCKKCHQTIPISKITRDKTNPLQSENLRGQSGQYLSIPYIGRTKFLCNKRHELFGIIDWQ